MLTRHRAIDALREERFDVAVIGGGITGAGVALDAASRGYSVALVEKADFASGTSSRSSKLVHGGLRYLQRFDLGLVREALLERRLMVELAPHLVTPLPFVVPAFDGARPDRLMGIGLNMYDVMATPGLRARRDRRAARRRTAARPVRAPSQSETDRQTETARQTENEYSQTADDFTRANRPVAPDENDWSPARHRTISGDEVTFLLPALEERNPTGGYLFYDCQTDDVRLVLTILGEAERFGAVCANRLEAVALATGDHRHRDPHRQRDRPRHAITVRDAESGETFQLHAENVVNATGVWADRLRPDELAAEADPPPRIVPSRGTHITVAQADLPLVAGAIVPAGHGRSVFALPWLGRVLIGTTDKPYDGDIDHVTAAVEDVDYLLAAVNRFFGSDLEASAVTGAFAGVRPLISAGDTRRSVDISRRAELYETSSGLITITGGKLTTWRRMAKLTVDRLVERDGREAPCRTDEIPLGAPVHSAELKRLAGVSPAAYDALAARYGHAAHRVIETAAERPELAEPIIPGLPDLLAEAPFAARHEQARSVGDVLFRRTRLGLLAAPQLAAAAGRVAHALAGELEWDEPQTDREIERVRHEAEAQAGMLGGAIR